MRSKTSFFDWTTFKKTIARFWPLWAVYLVIWLIVLPLQGLVTLRMEAADSIGGYGYMDNFAWDTVPDMTYTALVLAVVFGVLAAMAVFSHLYNARSANLFGSLPIRREALFLTHYLAGLAFLLVPNAIVFLLTLLVEAAGGCVSMQGLLFWLGAACGECFFFYSMAVFCAMFTGHILALPAFYGVFNILVIGVSNLLYAVLMEFYYGFAGFGSAISDVVLWLTPVARLGQSVQSWWAYPSVPESSFTDEWLQSVERELITQGLDVVGIYALAAAVLTVCAFFLYRVRRLESAGDVVAVQPMKPVFKYGLALCAGLLFGYATRWVTESGTFGLTVSILLWGVAGYFAAQMLLDKSFRVFHKWKGAAALAGAFAVMFVVVGFDLTGYVTRVPDAASVREVHIDGLSAVNWNDSGDWASVTVTDPGQIEMAAALHRAAVDQRDQVMISGVFAAGTRVELTYTLDNGSTLSRRYWLELDPDQVNQEGTTAWAVEKLYQDKDLYWRVYGFDRLEQDITEGKRLDSAEFTRYVDYGGESFVLGYGSDARALLDAVEEDFRAGRIGVRTLADTDYFGYGRRDVEVLTFRVVTPESGNTWSWLEIAIQDTASSTRAEMERLTEKLEDEAQRKMVEEGLEKALRATAG